MLEADEQFLQPAPQQSDIAGASWSHGLPRKPSAEAEHQEAGNVLIQFIKSTFLELVRNHFAVFCSGSGRPQGLPDSGVVQECGLAAASYSHDNIDQLKQKGLDPTFAQLRLAFLLGARNAARLIQAQPQKSVCEILPRAVIKANPFMANMTAADLLVRAASDVEGQERVTQNLTHGHTCVTARPPMRQVKLQIACKGTPASCRRLYTLRARKAVASRARRGKA